MKSWLIIQNRSMTLSEWLVVAAIVVILAAFLAPTRQWASSGTVTIPVEVVVFDAHSATAIEGALVAMEWAPPATGEFELHEYRDQLSSGFSAIQEIGAKTNNAGLVTIAQEFRTGSSHKRPIPHAHVQWYWLLVSAEDYGGVAVPFRYESMSSKDLKAFGRLPAYVGLTRIRSE